MAQNRTDFKNVDQGEGFGAGRRKSGATKASLSVTPEAISKRPSPNELITLLKATHVCLSKNGFRLWILLSSRIVRIKIKIDGENE